MNAHGSRNKIVLTNAEERPFDLGQIRNKTTTTEETIFKFSLRAKVPHIFARHIAAVWVNKDDSYRRKNDIKQSEKYSANFIYYLTQTLAAFVHDMKEMKSF